MEQINFDEILTIRDVIRRISRSMCLSCYCNLDKALGRNDWQIPLCDDCRNKFLEEEKVLK